MWRGRVVRAVFGVLPSIRCAKWISGAPHVDDMLRSIDPDGRPRTHAEVHFDYCFFRAAPGREAVPTLALKDRDSRAIAGHVVRQGTWPSIAGSGRKRRSISEKR